MSTELIAPEGVDGLLRPVLVHLTNQSVRRLEVFEYSRPGEPRFWQAFLFVGGQRFVVGTPEVRGLPLQSQLDDLVGQLFAFTVDEARKPGDALLA